MSETFGELAAEHQQASPTCESQFVYMVEHGFVCPGCGFAEMDDGHEPPPLPAPPLGYPGVITIRWPS